MAPSLTGGPSKLGAVSCSALLAEPENVVEAGDDVTLLVEDDELVVGDATVPARCAVAHMCCVGDRSPTEEGALQRSDEEHHAVLGVAPRRRLAGHVEHAQNGSVADVSGDTSRRLGAEQHRVAVQRLDEAVHDCHA